MARPFLLGSALLTFLTLAGGCADESFDLPAGAQCHRSIQCGTGLACVLGVCGNDPTDIGGMVPENPGDMPGGGMDASMPAMDGGSPPPPPPPPMDSGTPEPPPPPADGG